MPNTKKIAQSLKKSEIVKENSNPKDEITMGKKGCCYMSGKILKLHLTFLGAFIVLLAVLGYFFKDKVLVALVNNKPIFRYQLNQQLVSSFGKDALENLIVEDLIKAEVKKQNISITKETIEEEIKKIETSLGDQIKLEDALKQQGMTLESFRSQIETRLQVYKILDKEVNVTDEEISAFMKESGEMLTATSEAEKITEATGILKEQKINEKIQTWISDLLAKAKITRFLK